MSRPRVLLADDHRIVAEGLKSLLEPEFELIEIVENGRALVDATRRVRPDVIVADISMPELNGIDALMLLKRDDPDVRVVFLTMHRDVNYARRAIEAGALGFVLKHAAARELVLALRAALCGKTFISPAFADDVLRAMKSGTQSVTDRGEALTVRQREILQLVAEGCTAKEVGKRLGLSARTVEFHKYRMMESLCVRTNAELVQFALRNGVV